MSRTQLSAALILIAFVGCRKAPPEPEGSRAAPADPEPQATATSQATTQGATPQGAAQPSAAAEGYAIGSTQGTSSAAPSAGAAAPTAARVVPNGHRPVDAKPVAPITPSPDDPIAGKFTLDEAVKGLPAEGRLVAEIRTDLGKLVCDLYEDKAPITVANFVGLARGLRPFKNPEGKWAKAPAYDGTTFHRIVKGFMIQGGDPAGTGAGNPGYVIPDEIWQDAYHSERGLLCMANRGPNTNAMQFFIMDGSAPHLDGGYTIFGKCGPEAVIDKIASAEVRGDRAVTPPKIQKVTVRREPAKK